MKTLWRLAGCVLCVVGALSAATNSDALKVNGWVLDSACALTKGLSKPISSKCALACAKGGSPLVVMDDKGVIYLPISDTMPAISQNEKLLPFAGKRVTVTGRLYEKSGTKGIVIESVQPEPSRQ